MINFNIYEAVGKDLLGNQVSFAYCGIDEGLVYIMPFVQNGLLKQNIKIKKKNNILVEELGDYIKSATVDLLIVAADKKIIEQIYDDDYILMPFRVHQIVDTYEGWEKVKSLMSHRELQRSAKLKIKNNFSYFITNKDEDFFNFYKTMHKPTMDKRHGEFARSVEITTAYEDIFKKGLLFLITQNDIIVSGSVSQVDKEKNWLNTRLIGILNGDDQYRLNGAQNYVYHAILHWASTVGNINVVDFQGSEPFLTKGTFQYKKRFATEVILPPNKFYDKRLLVKANFKSDSIRNYFIDNPVMLVDKNDNLGVGYFYDNQHSPKLDIPYECPGFSYKKLIDIK